MCKKSTFFCFICLFLAVIVTACATGETKESGFSHESGNSITIDETDTTYTVEELKQDISISYKNAEILDIQVSETKTLISGAGVISRNRNGMQEMGVVIAAGEGVISYVNLNSKEKMFEYIPDSLRIDHDSDSIIAGMKDTTTNVEYIYTIEVAETLDNGVKGINLIVSRK